MSTPLGYQWLIQHYVLRALPLDECAYVSNIRGGRQSTQQGGQVVHRFEPNYDPGETLAGQIQFALRYEGVNLQVLSLLFAKTGPEELVKWLLDSPQSQYARRACFLFEWLTGQQLPIEDPVPSRARYVLAVDPAHHFVWEHGERSKRFRVTNNLAGPPSFCPLVRRTDYLNDMVRKDLRKSTFETLARYDEDLLRRAAAFLYLKETQSSFEVEREKPSPKKAQRFADMLRQADAHEPLTEERLVELQNTVIDPRFHEFTWRHRQNWIGKDLGHRQQIDFVPARPEDLQKLMDGLLTMSSNLSDDLEEVRDQEKNDKSPSLVADFVNQRFEVYVPPMDPVIAAACIAFGFVYIHPFMDGNGRIHRYLIHDTLAKAGFTPRGIVLPVSAVILANLDDYIETLEHFSRPLNRFTDYNPDTPDIPAVGNDTVYFRYPDLTRQTEFLYRALERTVEHDLQEEIDFLLGFDRACRALNGLLDWPDHSLELFVRVVRQNDGLLSANKRKSHFDWMTEEEIAEAEKLVREAFSMNSE
ncbi:Fic family protein [Alloalcanivorax mobilis]|uniref:Fic family protein n=1 Tax=Alloalcanivorax mobilis TaxID=2019569 RepID=UPI000C76BE82|nr:Fic family protein [Alloalcanivorax mobilis]